MQVDYKQKYLKYKAKYEQLKQIRGGGNEFTTLQFKLFLPVIINLLIDNINNKDSCDNMIKEMLTTYLLYKNKYIITKLWNEKKSQKEVNLDILRDQLNEMQNNQKSLNFEQMRIYLEYNNKINTYNLSTDIIIILIKIYDNKLLFNKQLTQTEYNNIIDNNIIDNNIIDNNIIDNKINDAKQNITFDIAKHKPDKMTDTEFNLIVEQMTSQKIKLL
jgi:hypothetical protein